MKKNPARRILSLLPCGTEMVCALGLGDELVGRSHECDFPNSVKTLPVCSEPKIDIYASSLSIDTQVREVIEKALSIYHIHADRLKALKPDVIVTQSQCEVCAVSPGDIERALSHWVGTKPKIVSLEPSLLEDVWKDILRLSETLEVSDQGKRLIQSLRGRVDRINEKTNARCKRPRVACIEWIEPLMSAGNWVPELVERAGGENLFGESGKHSPRLDFGMLIRKDPEVIVILPCGYDIPRIRKELPVLTDRSEWKKLSAVGRGQVYISDGHQFFNRLGPRLVESLEILSEIFHPDIFHFGHEGRGWERL